MHLIMLKPVTFRLLLSTAISPTSLYDFVTDCELLDETYSNDYILYYCSHLQLFPTLRMNGAIHPLPLYTFIAKTGRTLLNCD
jgi:hypothetical protein